MKQYKHKQTGDLVLVLDKKGNTVQYYRFAAFIKKQVLCSDSLKNFNKKYEEQNGNIARNTARES